MDEGMVRVNKVSGDESMDNHWHGSAIVN